VASSGMKDPNLYVNAEEWSSAGYILLSPPALQNLGKFDLRPDSANKSAPLSK